MAPSSVASQLRNFPKVKVVLAHAGHGIFSGEAIAIAQKYSQVYLEPSWCTFYNVGAMVDVLGPERVLFGSDLPGNIQIQIDTFKALGLSRDAEELVFGKAAKELFQLN